MLYLRMCGRIHQARISMAVLHWCICRTACIIRYCFTSIAQRRVCPCDMSTVFTQYKYLLCCTTSLCGDKIHHFHHDRVCLPLRGRWYKIVLRTNRSRYRGPHSCSHWRSRREGHGSEWNRVSAGLSISPPRAVATCRQTCLSGCHVAPQHTPQK